MCAIQSADDVSSAVADITSIKRVSKATHPAITAWIAGSSSGFDDCGEKGAGQRLLDLLEQKSRRDVLVSVTRWFGGAQLGAQRFRVINRVAKDALDDN